MTKEALGKLNERQAHYCEILSATIEIERKKAVKANYERACGKLRGFLECLLQMGALTGSEMKALYLWFFTEDRSKRGEQEA